MISSYLNLCLKEVHTVRNNSWMKLQLGVGNILSLLRAMHDKLDILYDRISEMEDKIAETEEKISGVGLKSEVPV